MERKRAFSLVELLISLIIISLVVAAFAPIMTKKLSRGTFVASSSQKRNEILLTSKSAGKDEQFYSCDKEITTDSDGKRYLNCTLKNLPASVGAILVGGGGGGGGAEDNGTGKITETFDASNPDKLIPIRPDMKNIKLTLHAAGGGGG